jgi:ribosomal protein S18 acetylase RimI-like enzyme
VALSLRAWEPVFASFGAVLGRDGSHDEPGSGEVEMLTVDPAAQRRGTGTRLLEAGLAVLRDAGVRLGVIGTGGDPGHAPARRTSEAAGVVEGRHGLPSSRNRL